MVAKCPEWMKYCASGKDWPTALIVIGSVMMLLLLVQAITHTVLFCKKYQKKGESEQQCLINSMIIALCIVRIPWWWFNVVSFQDNTPPAISVMVLNRLGIWAAFMVESFYVYTWLKLVLLLSRAGGRKVLQVFFIALNVLISLCMTAAIIITIVDRTPRGEDNNYGIMYSIATYMPAVVSLLLSVIFAAVGTILQVKLHGFFDFCSRPIVSFLVVTLVFIIATTMRFVGLFYSKWTNGKHMKSDVFATVTYFLPDVLPVITISLLQIQMILKIRREAKPGETYIVQDDSACLYLE